MTLVQIKLPRQASPTAGYPSAVGQRVFARGGGDQTIRVHDCWTLGGPDGDCVVIRPGGAWARINRDALDGIQALAGLTLAEASELAGVSIDGVRAFLEDARQWGVVSVPGEPTVSPPARAWSEDFGLLVLKLTNVCNIDCTYCYNGGVDDGEALTEAQGVEILRRALDQCPVGLNVVLHGGEPLVERERIGQLCEFAVQYAAEQNKQVYFNIQTNATLLNDAALDLIDRYDIGVGVSLDGPGALNALRINHGGQPTVDRVWRGIERLRERGRGVNVITVVTSQNADHLLDIVLAFQERGIVSVKFSPFLQQGYGEHAPSNMAPDPARMADGLIRVIDAIAEGEIHSIKVNDVCDLLKRCLSWGEPTMCHRGGPCGAGRDMLAVYPQGDVYACDCLVHERFKLGTLDGERTLAEIVDHPAVEALGRRTPSSMTPCNTCALQQMCGGTMTCRAFWSSGDEQQADPAECLVNQRTLQHLLWKVTESDRLVRYFLRWEAREGESLEG